MTNLNKTLLSLNRKEILQLPGFEHLGDYLYKELKEFVRKRMHELTTKKRGYKVKEYLNDYNGVQFKAPYQTARKKVQNRRKDKPTKISDKKVSKKEEWKKFVEEYESPAKVAERAAAKAKRREEHRKTFRSRENVPKAYDIIMAQKAAVLKK